MLLIMKRNIIIVGVYMCIKIINIVFIVRILLSLLFLHSCDLLLPKGLQTFEFMDKIEKFIVNLHSLTNYCVLIRREMSPHAPQSIESYSCFHIHVWMDEQHRDKSFLFKRVH